MLIFRPEAEADIDAAYRWYEHQRAGLGEEFLDALDQTVNGIRHMPQQHPFVHLNIQRALLRRFPYAVFFLHDEPRTAVLAVMHQSRDPTRWQGRV